MFVTHIEI